MSIWLRVLASRSLSSGDSARIQSDALARVEPVARYYGETVPSDLASTTALRLPEPGEHTGAITLPGGTVALQCLRDADVVAESCADIDDELSGWDDGEPGLAEVRHALGRVTEIVLVEVDVDWTEGASWPCLVALCIALAAAGEGIVSIDGEGYFAPAPSGFEHLLDSD
jgi:hypothetical protein